LVRSRAEFLAPDWEELAVEDEDEVSKLRHVCAFVLSEEGRRLCDKKRIDPAERALLDQRASAVLSFQPRFVVASLQPYAEGDKALPPMDDNGLADPYVVLRIQAGGGGGGGGARPRPPPPPPPAPPRPLTIVARGREGSLAMTRAQPPPSDESASFATTTGPSALVAARRGPRRRAVCVVGGES